MNFFALNSPPRTAITDFPMYFSAKIKITNPRTNNVKSGMDFFNILIIGLVIVPIISGTPKTESLGEIAVARKREDFENSLKNPSRTNTIMTNKAE